MKIHDDVLSKAVEKAAVEQTARDYIQNGYSVKRQSRVGEFTADLLARKGDKIIVFEFKSGRWNAQKAQAVTRLRNHVVHVLAGEFKLVLVNMPRYKEITVDGIENVLNQVLGEDTSQVDALATHVWLDEVADVDISSVDINADRIEVVGSGNVSYGLQYGSDSDVSHDDGLRSAETFPFTFHVELNHDLSVLRVEEIDIDTSSFYE